MVDADLAGIKPITIYTDKDLQREYDHVNSTLVDTDLDWSKRFDALKRLQSIIVGEAYMLDGFSSFMLKIANHMCVQLNDLRSAISKEAARTLCIAAKVSGERLEAFCEKIVSKEGLFKLINCANKVIAENGHICISYLIEYVQPPRIIPKFVEELNSKNPLYREKITCYIKKILSSYSVHIIEKYCGVIETGIQVGITDASKIARANTRSAYLLYAKKFPQRAAKIYSRFDSAIQKAIQEDSAKENVECQEKKPQDLKKEKKSEATPKPKEKLKSGSKQEKARDESKGSEKKMRNPLSEKKDMENRRNSLDASQTEKKREGNEISNARESEKKQKTETSKLPPKHNNSRKSEQETTENTLKTSQSSRRFDTKTADTKIEMKSTQINQSPVPTKSKLSLQNNQSERQDLKIILETLVGQTDCAEVKVLNLDDSFENIDFKSTYKTFERSTKFLESRNFYKSMKEEDLEFLLEKTKDQNWATRITSFEKIREFLLELPQKEKLDTAIINRLVLMLAKSVADENIKIALASLQSVKHVVNKFKEELKTHLMELLTSVLLASNDEREKVRTAAGKMLEVIQAAYPADELICTYLKIFESVAQTKEKIILLEQIGETLPRCKDFFDSTSDVTHCISIMVAALVEFSKIKQVYLPCLEIINFVKTKAPKLCLGYIIKLPTDQLATFRYLCGIHLHELEEDIQAHLLRIKQESIPITYPRMGKSLEAEDEKTRLVDIQHITQRNSSAKKENNIEKKGSKDKNAISQKLESLSSTGQNAPKRSNDLDIFSSINGILESATDGHHQEAPENQYEIIEEQPQSEETEGDPNQEMEIKPENASVSTVDWKESMIFPVNSKDDNKKNYYDIETLELLIIKYYNYQSVWSSKLSFILQSLFNIIETSGPRVAELGLDMLGSVAGLPIDLTEHIEELLKGVFVVLDVHYQNPVVDTLWETLFQSRYREHVLDYLIRELGQLAHPVCQLIIKEIGTCLGYFSLKDARPYLKLLIDQYLQLINHPNPDIRKSVVFSLVDLCFLYGEQFDQYTKQFSPSHQKLIEIYRERRSKLMKEGQN